MSGLEKLSAMEYPGRFIILGVSPDGRSNVAIYGITGRSPSSQARKLTKTTTGIIKVEPTDPEILKQGNPDLLVYDALAYNHHRLAVSNGVQTQSVFESTDVDGVDSWRLLEKAQHQFTYEPDKPNFTPRISGVINREKDDLVLGIIYKPLDSDEPVRNTFDLPMVFGRGYLISTYTGENKNPLPSFQGFPLEVEIDAVDPKECAQNAYDALAPKEGKTDFRVAVAAVYTSNSSRGIVAHYPEHYIINRHDLGAKSG